MHHLPLAWYQYRPGDGCRLPFTEKIHTYQVRIRKDRVEVHSEKTSARHCGRARQHCGSRRLSMPEQTEDAFYVGYLPVPNGIAASLQWMLPAGLLAIAGIGLLIGVARNGIRAPANGRQTRK